MAYPSAAIANWFLDRASKDNVTLSPMKLQKLIYFAHGWSLAILNAPLIEEHPEAWDYGPVIPSIYHEFKEFGAGAITARATELSTASKEGGTFLLNGRFIEPSVGADDHNTNALLERVWQVYGKFSPVQLSNMTHAPKGAWHQAYEASKGRKGVDISDDLIKAEFIAKTKAQGGKAA